MLNVFVKKSAEELYVQLSDGRMMLLEERDNNKKVTKIKERSTLKN